MRPHALIPLLGIACGSGNPENSAVCGFTSIAASTLVLQSLQNIHAQLTEAPPELIGTLPARVVGYGTSRALAAKGPEGAVLGYEGGGFPSTPPGFGLLLIDDSSEVMRGVLIFETEPPNGFTQIGTISGASATLPLFGTRINWPSVSDPKCPLFAPARPAGN